MNSVGAAGFITAAEHSIAGPLTLAVVADAASFRDLRMEWTELLRASGVDNFFLSWEWLHTWWTHFGSESGLQIVTVRENARLVALAPLTLRPARWLRAMPFRALEFLGRGNVGSDYLALIVREGCEDAALRALADYFAQRGFALEFSHVERQNRHMQEAAEQLRARGWHEHCESVEFCPYIALDGHTWDSYLATLGRTHRTNFKRKLKKLGSLYRMRIDEARTEAERRAALGLLVDLHLKRRHEVGSSDALHTRELLAFHEELTTTALARGWLRLHVMWLDDTPVAAMYGFEYGNVFYFYQSGFDSQYATYSVGLVMAGLVIKNAIERGVREFDFLHGEEGYKYLWASAERELVRYQHFPPTTGGALMARFMKLRRRALQLRGRPRHGPRPKITGRPPPAWSTERNEQEDT